MGLPSRLTFRCPLRSSSSTVMDSPSTAPIRASVRASSRTTFGASLRAGPNPRRTGQTASATLGLPAGEAGESSLRMKTEPRPLSLLLLSPRAPRPANLRSRVDISSTGSILWA
jgi:hypothetical protein